MDCAYASPRPAGVALPTSSGEHVPTMRVQLVYYQSAIQLNYYKRGLFPVLEMDNLNRLSASVVLSFPSDCEMQHCPSLEVRSAACDLPAARNPFDGRHTRIPRCLPALFAEGRSFTDDVVHGAHRDVFHWDHARE